MGSGAVGLTQAVLCGRTVLQLGDFAERWRLSCLSSCQNNCWRVTGCRLLIL